MRTKKKCILATKNKGKIREFERLFSDLDLEFLSLLDLDNPPAIHEDGETFQENALKKAETIAKHYGILTISDDSGLEVDALDRAPGIHSARYAGENASDQENYMKLLQELKDVPPEKRTARFRCVMVAYHPDGDWVSAEGTLEGTIAMEPQGSEGFGYDPVFFLPDYGKTVAQIPQEEKNRISHRAKALAQLHQKIKSLLLKR